MTVMIRRPVRSQQQDIRTEVGDRTAPGFASWVEEQTVHDVQPGKTAGRRGHDGGSHFGVAPGTGGVSVGVGRSRAIRMTWENIQGGVREASTAKPDQTLGISRSSLQVH
jgi:hypothetical protein